LGRARVDAIPLDVVALMIGGVHWTHRTPGDEDLR
jgi:hypothetical protein